MYRRAGEARSPRRTHACPYAGRLFSSSPYKPPIAQGTLFVRYVRYFSAPVVYNTKRSGDVELGGRRFLLRRVAFPRDPLPEWFAVDLLENAERAGTSADAVASSLASAVARG